jgi:peptide/nickel transport system substrate-binding protein
MSLKNRALRTLVYLAAVLALLVAAAPRGLAAAPAQQGGSRLFPETNQTVAGRFLEVWSQNGDYATNLYINGFPLTDKHPEINFDDGKVYQTQWFERARFEEHPENSKPYDVLLGRLGAYTAEGRSDAPFKKIAAKPASCAANCDYFKESQHTVSGDIRTYFYKYGGIAQFGFPLSETFTEQSKDDPNKQYTVQYFERQRFELHPENQGTIYAVLLGRLGAEQMNQSARPATAITRGNNPVDVLKIGRGQDPGTMLPYSDNSLIGTRLRGFVFNSLTSRNDKSQPIADLAVFLPTIENGGAYYVGTGDAKHLVVKYKLKRGVKWADGQEVTSNDVIYTYKLWLDPKVPANSRQGAEYFDVVDNPDAYTVIFNYLTWPQAADLIKRDAATYGFLQAFVDTKAPVTQPTYNEVFGAVLPEHFLKSMAPADIADSDYARTPWGTGPYKVTKWETGQEMTLDANPNYNVEVDKPVIKQIYSPLFSDNKQIPVALDTGTIDMSTDESLTPDLLPTYVDLDKKGKIKLFSIPTLGYEHIDFNTQKAPFDDVRVRQAVLYGLDMNAINQAVFGGGITLINSYIPATNWASIENPDNAKKFPDIANQLTKYTYNVDKAKSLLDAAGWTVGSDGIREKGGKKLKITWLTTTKAYRVKIATIQQQYMKAIGIDSTPNPVPSSQTFAPPPDGPLYSGSYGDFGVIMFAYGFTTDEPAAVGTFDSTQIPSAANGFAGGNDLFWSNADADKYAREAESYIGRPDARIKAYMNHQLIVNQQLPTAPLFALPTIWLANKNISNFKPDAYQFNFNAQQWYLGK